jgi:hypothetical protein
MGKPADPLGDLISFDSVPASKPSGAPAFDGFTDFVDADPLKSTDNDFSDFQECKKAQAPAQTSSSLLTSTGINLQSLKDMYN